MWLNFKEMNSLSCCCCRLSGCDSKGPLNCSGCFSASYCSRYSGERKKNILKYLKYWGFFILSLISHVHFTIREHQKQDWSAHRAACAPFKLVRKPGVGRHLVATRDISPGEVILQGGYTPAANLVVPVLVFLGCYETCTWHKQNLIVGHRYF